MKARTALTSGIGEFSPGIFRLGYDGGGPYRCMAISHGGGTLWAFCRRERRISSAQPYPSVSLPPQLAAPYLLFQSGNWHSLVLLASPRKSSAHQTDLLASSPSAVSQTPSPEEKAKHVILWTPDTCWEVNCKRT